MNTGDYVLATKYQDGDPGDGYAVGFYDRCYDHFGQTRHMVVDNEGKQFRGNGFRRCEPINDAEGRWLIEHFPEFQPMWSEEVNGEDRMCGKSVWDWLAEARDAVQASGDRT